MPRDAQISAAHGQGTTGLHRDGDEGEGPRLPRRTMRPSVSAGFHHIGSWDRAGRCREAFGIMRNGRAFSSACQRSGCEVVPAASVEGTGIELSSPTRWERNSLAKKLAPRQRRNASKWFEWT